jgi:predicted ester cyclase
VATRWTVRMTHLGDAFAPATNKRLMVTGMTFWRIRENKIAEAWNNWDMMGMLNAIGQTPHTKVL